LPRIVAASVRVLDLRTDVGLQTLRPALEISETLPR
jgi:hypothetical protein